MSDQPSPPPQRPKPGSLRDRIAAFETSSTPASTVQRPPAPRPTGKASWKPTVPVPSPPSSPSSRSTDRAASPSLKAMGAMSASDAKESITKGGGSLKDRMAALQGKGAFGAPSPPLAPKPAVDKPKWNPPPAVAQPIDNDQPDATTADDPSAIAAPLHRTKSPPTSVKSRNSVDLSKPVAEVEGTSTAAESAPATSTGGDVVEGTTDPEEEERQRRAAIAARMARLGGARLGMAPSVVAKKPPMPIRKPTRDDEQGATVASPTSPTAAHPQPQSDVEQSPVRKDFENVSVDSTDSNIRNPHHMPVPTVPRRAGPPRKKPAKPEAHVEEAVVAPSVISKADDHKAVETEEEAILTPEHKEPDHKTIDDHHQAETHDEPRSIDSDVQQVVEPASTVPAHDIQSPLPDEPKQEHEHEHEHESKHVDPDHVDQPDDVDTTYEDQPGATGTDEDAEEEEDNVAAASPLRLSSEESGSPVVASHASPEGVTHPVSPSRPDMPTRRVSVPPHEVAEPQPLAVESKVEEGEEGEPESSDGLSDETRTHNVTMEKSSFAAYSHAEAAPVRQLPDSILRPPVPESTRPYVQLQQYGGSDDVEEEHNAHHATRYLPPLSRLPDPPISHEEESPPVPPARFARPPRRIVPQAPEVQEQEEEEEEAEEAGSDDEVVPSHLFVRPPRGQHPVGSGRHYEADDDDGSDNDTPALPVLQRRSTMDSIPPPTPPPPPPTAFPSRHHHSPTSSSTNYEHDIDHDGQELPVRPLHTVVPPTPPTPVFPRPTRRPSDSSPPKNKEVSPSSYGMPLVAVSEPEPGEILDDEEGDPIDPSFHSPSRRTSEANIRASAEDDDNLGQEPSPPLPALPVKVEKREEAQQQDSTKRQTLAERMAKLGGIKFGTTPIPAAMSRPPVPRDSQEGLDEEGEHPQADTEHVEQQPVEPSEEEEERARKERIAAKLAGMGGMRIGMMPMGMGPQRAHVLKDENVAPPSPTRAVPPVRLPLLPPTLPQTPILPQTPNTDSQQTSDDGVKVESEMEEADVVDQFDATTPPPPPVPSRGGQMAYRRVSTGNSTSLPSPPPIPGSRPPIPVALPRRRSSVQTTKSTGSVEAGFSPSRSTFSHVFPQSEYVIVDEPHSLEEAKPPSRRTSRIGAPVRSPPNPMPVHTTDPNTISESSHWELPSIPTAALDIGSGGDLSMSSWTDLGEPTSPTSQRPPPPPKKTSLQSHKPKPSEVQLSADDLMAVWGRVGVQVCEVATSLFENSKKSLIGDGTYAGFITAVLAGVPNAAPIAVASGEYGYLVYAQNGSLVQKRASEIMPGDIVEIHEGKLKGHKGLQTYHQNVGGSGEALLGIVGEFEAKKTKIRVFHANQHVGQQQYVESVSYRLEDLKSGTVKVYRVLEG